MIRPALLAVALGLSLPAHSALLLDENFDDVPVGTVESALASATSGLPAGTQWSSTGNARPVNLRAGTDTINTYNAGNPNQRFSFATGTTFFNPNTAANHFLVLGDDSGQLAGTPYDGTFALALPFALPAAAGVVTVSFDWVFKAFTIFADRPDYVSTDRLLVGIAGAGFDIAAPTAGFAAMLLDQTLTEAGGLQGPASFALSTADLGAADVNGNHYLVFALNEALPTFSQSTNSSAGFDNVLIDYAPAESPSVPEPGSLALLALGLTGLLAARRRRDPTA